MIRLRMESDQVQRRSKRRLIVGILIGVIIVLVVSVAVTIGLIFGQMQDNTSEIAEVPVFLSVTSFGTSDNMTRLDVSYRSGTHCQPERRWTYMGSLHLEREIPKPETDEKGVSTVHIHDDFSQVKFTDLVLHCHDGNARMVFRPTALDTPGTQVLVNQTDTIPFHIVNTSLDTSTGEFIVTLNISKDMVIAYFFTGLNTSTTPAVPIEHFEYDLQNETGKYKTTATIEGDTKQYRIIIDSDLVKTGGKFVIDVETQVSTKYVKEIRLAKGIWVMSPVTGEVVPRGYFGVYYGQETIMDMYGDIYRPWCYMMGNPLPHVETYIRDRDNKTIRIDSRDLQFDEYTRLVVVMVKKEEYSDGGTFICRTIPGDDDFETEFRFRDYLAARIDTDESGVIEQTPERDVIRCTARGSPLPEVEICLYDRHGPNLLKTGLFQVSRSNTSDTISSMTLTISPPNKDIHTVYCNTHQEGGPWAPISPKILELKLYPGHQYNHTLTDMMWNAIEDNLDR